MEEVGPNGVIWRNQPVVVLGGFSPTGIRACIVRDSHRYGFQGASSALAKSGVTSPGGDLGVSPLSPLSLRVKSPNMRNSKK